ncbi:MAG TPA: T9SS type B sorting domain-containing protein [Flavobacterium sp.]|jgi:gliding motility-associated-like protein
MKRTLTSIICILITALAFSQQEASVWYFGQNAGLKFQADGSVLPLSDGLLVTEEGCSSIADASGNLLFYTDGRTVWDRNHVIMPNGNYSNGTGLFGDPSSTQSAIIVPKPGEPNIYYIFTIDEPHHENAAVYPNAFTGSYVTVGDGITPIDDDGLNMGLNYSVVDLSITGSNGSFGDVTFRNNHLITYDSNPAGEEIKYKCSEKITAVKNELSNEYWVITHFLQKFYAFKVSSIGVTTSPITTTIGPNIGLSGYRRNAQGYLKTSPDGEKIAVVHAQNGTTPGEATFNVGQVLLYSFNKNSGLVSNEAVVIDNVQPYGVEFSAQSKKLYATYRDGAVANMELAQFNVESPNVAASKIVVENNSLYLYALQLAPNNKIYCATGYEDSLGVINNPDADGLACSYTDNAQPLAPGTLVRLGLPPFITSFFDAAFSYTHLCFGDNTEFSLNSTQALISISWNFGDGFTSNVANPSHQYAVSGVYTVEVTVTSANGIVTKSKDLTISNTPISNSIGNQTLCHIPNTNISLSQYDNLALGTQSTSEYGVAYFANATDAAQHNSLIPQQYNLAAGNTTIFSKVYNLSNISCYSLGSFTITAFNQPVANQPAALFVCDDTTNDDAAVFNLTENDAAVLGQQNASEFSISYHYSQGEADSAQNAIVGSYTNTANPQTIYVRIQNNSNTDCYDIHNFQVGVYQMPTAFQPAAMSACDDHGNDGSEIFDLSSQDEEILGTQLTGFQVTYHLSQSDADLGSNALPANYSNTSNPQMIFARVENIQHPQCYDVSSFILKVRNKPDWQVSDSYTVCQERPITLTGPGGYSSYEWSTGAITQSIIVAQEGNYSLTVTKNYGDIICEATKNYPVYESSVAVITEIEVQDWSQSENMITVLVSGEGDYEYSLDGSIYQDSNQFYGLPNGQYTVYVNDKKECGAVDGEVYLLMYPHFFTPNADGFNDTWKIKFSEAEPDMEVMIFDRYGKIISGYNGLDRGWDGTLNGQMLPATDYWFSIQRANGKVYRGHFTLKR